MKGNVRKVRKTTIYSGAHNDEKRGLIHRFAKWVEDMYGIPFRSTYDKLRENRIKEWEDVGIAQCMNEYGFIGTPGDLWKKCARNTFCEFMAAKQMSRMTVWKRFGADNFNGLEIIGIKNAYCRWKENIEPNND